MRLLVLIAALALSMSAETISMTSYGRQGSTPTRGRVVVRFANADNSKSCLFVMASDSSLAVRGASATVTISAIGSWTVTERVLRDGVTVAKLNGNSGQGMCLMDTADETTYPLGATFEASVR